MVLYAKTISENLLKLFTLGYKSKCIADAK